MVLCDIIKQRFNIYRLPNLYFWRDKSGHEIDCILEYGENLVPIEIKSSETIHSEFFSNLIKWNELSGISPLNNYVIYGGHDKQNRYQGSILGWTYLGSAQLDFSEIKKQLYPNKISDIFFLTKGSSFFTTCQVKNKSTSKYS